MVLQNAPPSPCACCNALALCNVHHARPELDSNRYRQTFTASSFRRPKSNPRLPRSKSPQIQCRLVLSGSIRAGIDDDDDDSDVAVVDMTVNVDVEFVEFVESRGSLGSLRLSRWGCFHLSRYAPHHLLSVRQSPQKTGAKIDKNHLPRYLPIQPSKRLRSSQT